MIGIDFMNAFLNIFPTIFPFSKTSATVSKFTYYNSSKSAQHKLGAYCHADKAAIIILLFL
jgi:hypothetical protein